MNVRTFPWRRNFRPGLGFHASSWHAFTMAPTCLKLTSQSAHLLRSRKRTQKASGQSKGSIPVVVSVFLHHFPVIWQRLSTIFWSFHFLERMKEREREREGGRESFESKKHTDTQDAPKERMPHVEILLWGDENHGLPKLLAWEDHEEEEEGERREEERHQDELLPAPPEVRPRVAIVRLTMSFACKGARDERERGRE